MSDDESGDDINLEEEEEEEEEFGEDITEKANPNEVIIVNKDERVTSNMLRKSEMAQVIAVRAKQIDKTGVYFCDIGNLTDPVKIAYRELILRKTPLKLRRRICEINGIPVIEEWDIREMSYPP